MVEVPSVSMCHTVGIVIIVDVDSDPAMCLLLRLVIHWVIRCLELMISAGGSSSISHLRCA